MANKNLLDQDEPKAQAPATVPNFTQADLAKEVDTIAKKLAKQRKVRIRIPLPEGVTQEEADSGKTDYSETVQINGYVTRIMRGHSVEVPESIAKVLEQAGKI